MFSLLEQFEPTMIVVPQDKLSQCISIIQSRKSPMQYRSSAIYIYKVLVLEYLKFDQLEDHLLDLSNLKQHIRQNEI